MIPGPMLRSHRPASSSAFDGGRYDVVRDVHNHDHPYHAIRVRGEVMKYHNRTCDPCKKEPPRSVESLLCQDCADAVSRVMSCAVYEANHEDRQAQLAQARL